MKLSERIFGNKRHYLTSKFGWRKHPITGKKSYHAGCDYGTGGIKLSQLALESGIVLSVSLAKTGYGKSVWVRYPRLGYSCFHAHLDSVNVAKGQKVDKKTIIGLTGTSGSSTGVHLHLGVQYIGSNDWVDPEKINYKEEVVKVKPIKKAIAKFNPMVYKIPKYKGDSIILALKSINVNSSFIHRKGIALRNGMKSYTGTAEQNLLLVSILKKGKLRK